MSLPAGVHKSTRYACKMGLAALDGNGFDDAYSESREVVYTHAHTKTLGLLRDYVEIPCVKAGHSGTG